MALVGKESGTAQSKRRRGRPPAAEAGIVDKRILATATELFLELGYGRTTLDKVSQLSNTGKSALYGRYPDKETLFGAVVERSIQQMFADLPAIPMDRPLRERLLHVGTELAKSLLVPRCVALMRITAAEANTFVDLAGMAYRVSFDSSVQWVREALGANRSEGIAERFVEVALQPMSFQAAFGADVQAMHQRSRADAEDAILLLEAKGLLSPEQLSSV